VIEQSWRIDELKDVGDLARATLPPRTAAATSPPRATRVTH
jgi:hypothetical protein